MRAVMDIGGFCAEGGPFEIRQRCPEGVPLIMVMGVFGLFGFGALMGWKGAVIGGVYAGPVLLAWPALEAISTIFVRWAQISPSGARHQATPTDSDSQSEV